MKSYQCTCGNRLFFDNTKCLGCGADTGFCPACQGIVALTQQSDGGFVCGNPGCAAALQKCGNYLQYDVCNRCVSVPVELSNSDESQTDEGLCDCCRFNHTIPDLTLSGNQQKWARLEAAKRRLFYELDLLGLPYGSKEEGFDPPLAFDFKGDVIKVNSRFHQLTAVEQVYTGHDSGTITINIKEADDVEREKTRVTLGEPQRTLLGHFRHEIGHYFWDLLVKNRNEDECIAVFGDHNSPEYSDALDAYYKNGPAANWSESFISAYASSHPWEDFAETFATYLNLISEFDTAADVGFIPKDRQISNFTSLIAECQQLCVSMNEMNRSFGVMDAMPKPIVATVVQKLQFIHELIRNQRLETRLSDATSPVESPLVAIPV